MTDRIVHLGVGNFHRAHQAWYTQRANAEAGSDWRITGVSLRRPDMRDALAPQHYRYTVEIEGGEGTDYQTIDIIDRVLVAREAPGEVIAAIADGDTHIVTLTVTEKGYSLNPTDRTLDIDDPGIRDDLAGGAPVTTIGLLAAGLAARRRAGAGGLTIISCDNLPENGHVLRAAILAFAGHVDSGLAGWIEDNVAFPCTMVDRIVPATTDALRARVEAATGVRDAWPVATERFAQWVIEDTFAGPRPAWEAAGAELVADVGPHELRKLRMLNGAHSALAYAGRLAGHDYVHEAVADPELGPLARAVMDEAAATLAESVRSTASDYAERLMRRFDNPGLAHQLIQIAMDGSQKLPVRLLAPLRERLAAGMDSPAIEHAIAAWLAFVMRCATAGDALDDPQAPALRVAARAGSEVSDRALRILALTSVFGTFASDFPDVAERLSKQCAERLDAAA